MSDPLVDWLETLVGVVVEAKVPHALAGGLAVGFWAKPRATVDIDLVVAADGIDRLREGCRRAGLLQTTRPIVSFRRMRMLRMLPAPESQPEPIAVDFLLVSADFEAE